MSRFTIPRDLYFGENVIDYLKEIKANKAMLVIGSERLIKDGTVPKIQENLKVANIETIVFTGVENDPSVATVRKGVEMMNEFNPDLIIGIGGGSPIDAAKAMWIFYEYPEFTFEEAAKPFNLPELRQKAKFIAIPTTSGTATEVTSFAVITDNETCVKYPNARNPITDALAMKSIEMIYANLINSYNGEDKARRDMHIAQSLAGMPFSNAILGIVHSMAHKSGKIFDIPHEFLNSKV